MFEDVYGFLRDNSWDGVVKVALFIAVGVIIGLTWVYPYLVPEKPDMPKRISIPSNVAKIILVLVLMYFVITI
jgi:putative copper export protein